jgi:hypothetical protein
VETTVSLDSRDHADDLDPAVQSIFDPNVKLLFWRIPTN